MPPLEPLADASIVEFARGLLAGRRLREKRLREVEFYDPAWDMLIDLFIAAETGQTMAVSSVSVAAAVPKSTALRTIGKLVKAGLLDRYPDPEDGRRDFVSLTADLHARLNALLTDMRGLTLGHKVQGVHRWMGFQSIGEKPKERNAKG